MKSLAVFSIFHPRRLGIADYSDDLVEALARHFDITCYVDTGQAPDKVAQHAEVKPHTEYRGRENHTLFQVGNSTELSFLVPHLVKHGGVVTLHDACQHDITHPYFKAHRWKFWTEVFRSLDPEARKLMFRPTLNPMKMFRDAVTVYQEHPEKRRHFSFTRFVLRHAHRVIVHSRFLEEQVRLLNTKISTDRIPHGIHPVSPGSRAGSRRFLSDRFGVSLGEDSLLFLSFGAIQVHKRIAAVLRAFKAFLAEHPDALYLLVGPRDPDYDIDADIKALGLGDRIKILDSYIPMEEVNECINASDVCFNLRWPSLGSTSGTLYKIFVAGRPVAVTSTESFADYPEDFTFPVPPPGEEDEWKQCLEVMRTAHSDPERLDEMGKSARKFANENCSWLRIAEKYAEALDRA